jgi:hypothetical protein
MSFENSGPLVQQPSSTDLSFIAGAGGVTAGQFVYISGPGTVSPTTGAQEWVGIVKVGAVAGKICTVMTGKVKARITASGTINPGDLVVSAAGGVGVTNNTPTTKHCLCDTGASNGGQAIVIP